MHGLSDRLMQCQLIFWGQIGESLMAECLEQAS